MIALLVRWWRKRRFAAHVVACKLCSWVVDGNVDPFWLCPVGRALGREVHRG